MHPACIRAKRLHPRFRILPRAKPSGRPVPEEKTQRSANGYCTLACDPMSVSQQFPTLPTETGRTPAGTAPAPAPLRSALTWRTVGAFIPCMVALCYWTSYSECVVSSTSFHAIAPPMHTLVAALFLAAVLVPLHRAVQGGRLASRLTLFAAIAGIVWVAGAWGFALKSTFTGDREFARLSVGAALLIAAALYIPVERGLRRSEPLSFAELIAVYLMLMVGTLVTSYATAHFLFPTLTSAVYFSQSEGRWKTWLDRVPDWFGPRSPEAVGGFWKGDVWQVPWGEWIGPLAAWFVLVLVIIWVMLCLNTLVQRQWIDRERLSFPLVTLPVAVARQEPDHAWNSFFRSPWAWAGVAVPVVLHTINGLHTYYPSFPTIEFRHINVMQGVDSAPWNAMRGLDVTFYPCIAGISYLLTLEVSLSVWFFYLLRKLLPVLGAATGWSDYTTPNGQIFPFADQQVTGAWLAIVVAALWLARGEMVRVLRAAIRGENGQAETALSYRTAVLGVILGTLFVVGWLWRAGMEPWVALLFIAIFFAWCVALARIRAEAGMGGLTGPMSPQEGMYAFMGSSAFGVQNLVLLQHMKWMTVDLRGLACVAPSQLEGLKLADTARLSGRSTAAAMMFAVAFGLLIVTVILVPLVYQYGGVTMNGQRFRDVPTQPFRELTTILANPRRPDNLEMGFAGFGFSFTLFLSWLRLNFLWWPFHPIGYAVGFSRRTVDWMWFSIFLGWAAKGLILKLGGMRLYRDALPFFLGMLLGEFVMGGVFGFIGCMVPDTRGYQLYP